MRKRGEGQSFWLAEPWAENGRGLFRGLLVPADPGAKRGRGSQDGEDGSHEPGGGRIHPVKAEGLRGWAAGQLLKAADARWDVHGNWAATKEHLH